MIEIRNSIENSPNRVGELFGRGRNKGISMVGTEDVDMYCGERKHFYIMKVIYNIRLIRKSPEMKDVRTVQQSLNRGISK